VAIWSTAAWGGRAPHLPHAAVLSAIDNNALACNPARTIGYQEDSDIGNLLRGAKPPGRNGGLHGGIELRLLLFGAGPKSKQTRKRSVFRSAPSSKGLGWRSLAAAVDQLELTREAWTVELGGPAT